MGSAIHMETEIARQVMREFGRTASEIEIDVNSLAKSTLSLNWQGPSRDAFDSEFAQLVSALRHVAEQGIVLSQRLEREINEWELVDGQGAGEFSVEKNQSWWFVPSGILVAYSQYAAISSFNREWRSWSREEKMAFLQERYDRLAEEYGLPKIDLVAEDLKDPFLGDAKGEFRGSQLVIDTDNIDSRDGYDTFQTLIHETRHQVQWQAVAEYREHGDQAQFPPGVTLEEVKQWDANEKNYIRPENDYPAYRKQPVEQDARGFAEKSASEYVKEKQAVKVEA